MKASLSVILLVWDLIQGVEIGPDAGTDDIRWNPVAGIEPVSYTHLDVYKRQIFFLPLADHASVFSAIGEEGVIG